MIGAILGDIIGSPYEFNRGKKTKDFPLFIEKSHFTDDTVMTIAVAEACQEISAEMSDDEIRNIFIEKMLYWGNKYPWSGYGMRFIRWLAKKNPQPYNSYGNGSAMRVSAVGWYFQDIDTVRRIARLSADVSHNHPEGIKGAEAVASVIFLSRCGYSKELIKQYIVKNFNYDLSRTCDEIRPDYYHVESCQESVPEAITAFIEGEDFIDVIRTAVSLGGDSDTLTAIAGSMAEAKYNSCISLLSMDLGKECLKRLPEEMQKILHKFYMDFFFDFLLQDGTGSIPSSTLVSELEDEL